jgi:hypothetical protein
MKNGIIFRAWCDVENIKNMNKKQDEEVHSNLIHTMQKQCQCENVIQEMRKTIKSGFRCMMILQVVCCMFIIIYIRKYNGYDDY